VFVNRTKDRINGAPDDDADSCRDKLYRGKLGSY
jgi:hypothetical protein